MPGIRKETLETVALLRKLGQLRETLHADVVVASVSHISLFFECSFIFR
jgi:hypothetical protein